MINNIAGAQNKPDADFKTPFEKSKGNYTATYDEAISYYKKLEKNFPQIKLQTYGLTDIGRPLHLVIVSADKDFKAQSLRDKNKRFILINNAIHAGEPEGVDASMMLVRDLVLKPELGRYLKNIVFLVIPVYNVDGLLNRGCCSRANQDGPEEYGFRANAQNLDLNRDFIKCNSRNARSFTQIFREWQPDVFLDNHTSNGADYQYTLTYIANHRSLDGKLADYLKNELVPDINAITKDAGYELCPYVDTKLEIPDSGLIGGISPPRFSAGYCALYNTIGFTVETHMLKPFDKRLYATYEFMKVVLQRVHEDNNKIATLRKQAEEEVKTANEFVVRWQLDTSRFDNIPFKGFAAQYKPSNVSGFTRLYYDKEQPFEKQICHYDYVNPAVTVKKPYAYIIPQSWWRVVELLQLNKVEMKRLANDTNINVEMYYIESYENASGSRPYEGHYLHTNTKVRAEKQNVKFYKGDYVINMNQQANRYVAETLEPQATDAFFSWNFFDAILQQKEYFSSYVFEDKAEEILQKNPELKKRLEEKRKNDPVFAKSAREQLNFVYRNSEYYEKTHNRYPVGRLMQDVKLGVE